MRHKLKHNNFRVEFETFVLFEVLNSLLFKHMHMHQNSLYSEYYYDVYN